MSGSSVQPLEPDLIVTLASGAVAYRVGASFPRDFDLALGNQRSCDRSAEQIDTLVQGIGPEHRKDEIADEFLAQVVVPISLRPPLRLFPRRFVFPLSKIDGEGNHLAIVGLLQPFQNDDVSSPPE